MTEHEKNLPSDPSPSQHVEPVAWLRHGEAIFVQNVPFGAMWISDKDDPRAFPVYATPTQQGASKADRGAVGQPLGANRIEPALQVSRDAMVPPQQQMDVEDIREQNLATIVAPDNGTPHEVLSAVLECARAWVPEARIIGNVRAGDIARAIETLSAPQSNLQMTGIELPADIIESLLAIGPVEWGQTLCQSDDKHIDDLRDTLRITREHFGIEAEETTISYVALDGTGTVLANTGMSPNSPQHARILAAAWNQLVEIAKSTTEGQP